MLTLQLLDNFNQFQTKKLTKTTISLTLYQEIKPILTALIITKHIDNSITTKLGTIRITKQIDTLKTITVNPIQYLITPHIITYTTIVPILTLFFTIVTLITTEYIIVDIINVNHNLYKKNIQQFLTNHNIIIKLIKNIMFKITITTIACFKNYKAHNNAQKIKKTTTQSIVFTFIAIFVLNYIITTIILI